MRRWSMLTLVLLTLLLIVAGVFLMVQQQGQPPAPATISPDAVAGVRRVTIEELRGELATSSPPLVWDIRTTPAFAEGHIPGSRPLTLDAIPDASAGLDKSLPIVTVCA